MNFFNWTFWMSAPLFSVYQYKITKHSIYIQLSACYGQRETQRWIIGCLKVRSGLDEAYLSQYNIEFIQRKPFPASGAESTCKKEERE